MKRGDMVRITSNTDGEIDGKLGIVIDNVDENLRPWGPTSLISGRICYTKVIVMVPEFIIRYLCPNSLEVIQ